MRREPEFFDDTEPALVYIAKKLEESLRLESLLNEAGIDYGVEADNYRAGRYSSAAQLSPRKRMPARSGRTPARTPRMAAGFIYSA